MIHGLRFLLHRPVFFPMIRVMKKLLVFKMPFMMSIFFWLLAGCASFQPAPMDVPALSARANVQTNAVLAVSVAWLSDAEIK